IIPNIENIQSAASFIAQRLSLDKGQLCFFIQNSTLVVNDKTHKVVVGLPSKESQLQPTSMLYWPGHPSAKRKESWNGSLYRVIQAHIFFALQRRTPTGQHYHMSGLLYGTVSGTLIGSPCRSHPFEFLMELPAQSQLGDVGYVTNSSPAFCQLFNIFDRDPTARYGFHINSNWSQNSFDINDTDALIFQEGPDHGMRFLGDRRFSTTIYFAPPTSGTSRRLFSLRYECYISSLAITDFNSIWSGHEPVGVELHPMEISKAGFKHTYWLNCSVVSCPQSAPSTTVNLDELEPQELSYDFIVVVDPVGNSHHIQLVDRGKTPWSMNYNTSLTLLETSGPSTPIGSV
ncbi:hypothetical protein FA95DRAFT_1578337, partial [Auriscalpium vulgare]